MSNKRYKVRNINDLGEVFNYPNSKKYREKIIAHGHEIYSPLNIDMFQKLT